VKEVKVNPRIVILRKLKPMPLGKHTMAFGRREPVLSKPKRKYKFRSNKKKIK
jgi:hypothetical protein